MPLNNFKGKSLLINAAGQIDRIIKDLGSSEGLEKVQWLKLDRYLLSCYIILMLPIA